MAIGNDLLFQFSDDAIEGINRVKISNVSGEKVSNMVMNVIVRTALRQIEWVGGRMLWSGRALNRS